MRVDKTTRRGSSGKTGQGAAPNNAVFKTRRDRHAEELQVQQQAQARGRTKVERMRPELPVSRKPQTANRQRRAAFFSCCFLLVAMYMRDACGADKMLHSLLFSRQTAKARLSHPAT